MYSGALAAAQAYDAVGNTAKATEMRHDRRADPRRAIVNVLWNPSRQLFEHRHVATNAHVPWKEINNYYPFSVGAIPNTDQYKQALRLFADPAEYPIFPFYTANQRRQGGGRGGRPARQQQLLHHQLHRPVPAVLLGAAQLPEPVDDRRGLQEAAVLEHLGAVRRRQHPVAGRERVLGRLERVARINYRSWIHHNILGSSNWTVIEDVMGLRPRNDNQIELSPDQHRLVALRGRTTSGTATPT